MVSPLRVLTFPSQCAAKTKNQKGMALLGKLIRGVSRNTLLTRWESHWIYARNQVHQAHVVSSKSKTYRLARLLRHEARLLGSWWWACMYEKAAALFAVSACCPSDSHASEEVHRATRRVASIAKEGLFCPDKESKPGSQLSTFCLETKFHADPSSFFFVITPTKRPSFPLMKQVNPVL